MWSMTAKDAKTSRQGRLACRLANSGARPTIATPVTSPPRRLLAAFSGTVPERLMAQLAHIAVCRWEHRRHEGTTWVSPRLQHPFLSLSSVISVLFSSALPSL